MEFITGTFKKNESDTFNVVEESRIESPGLTEELVSSDFSVEFFNFAIKFFRSRMQRNHSM